MLLVEASAGEAAPWSGIAGSAPRSTAPETYFNESGSFLHPRRTSSVPLLCSSAPGRSSPEGSPADGGGSPLDWEPSQQTLTEPELLGRDASGGEWGCGPEGAEEELGESPTKRSAWGRFASALADSEGEAAARAAEDARLQRVGSGDVEGADVWPARFCRGLAGSETGAHAPWGAAPDRASQLPLSISDPGPASQLLLSAPQLRCSFQPQPAQAWAEQGVAQAALPCPPSFASQQLAAYPDGDAPADAATQLPYAGEAWHASQPPPLDFYSQRESQAAPPPPAHLPAPMPFAARAYGDASRTPPHYSMESYMQHGCALDMSPGETGGSQYIASPLPPSHSRAYAAQADLPPSQPLDEAGQSQPGAAGAGAVGTPGRMPLFPIFMPRGQKTLHLVRHGESEYNAACGAPGSSWDDPIIWDAPLSALGRQQASGLGPALLAHGVSPGALWVASPLTRAIQTCLLARGALLGADAQRFPEPSQEQPWMMVRSELAEHLVTSGDVGRPASQLAAAFPQLAAATFAHLEDTWWYNNPNGSGKLNCAVRGVLQATEPKDELRRRIGNFRKWACARPERELVVFGHSTFFKYFTNSEGRLKNCEVLTLTL